MNETLENLFVYGTLIQGDIQQREIGRLCDSSPATLPDYKRSTIEIRGKSYPIAIPHDGAQIEGLVIHVTPQELVKLDKYETSAYKHVCVKLLSGDSAWVYRKPSG